jgi:hypothetical protein
MIKQLQETVAKYEAEGKAREQAAMSEDEKRKKEYVELEELRKWKATEEEAKRKKIEALVEENETTIKQLSEDLQAEAALLKGLDPEAMAKWLAHAKSRATVREVVVHGSAGRSQPDTPENREKALVNKGLEFVFGKQK